MKRAEKKWTTVITSKKKIFNFNLREVIRYKDLIGNFIGKSLKVKYRQTVLGPLWYVLQPVLNTLIFTLIFGTLARDITDKSIPAFLFYMAGNVPWLYFSACLTGTATVFTSNQYIYSKVYFPRLCTPISTVITNLVNFAMQFVLFLIITLVFFFTGTEIKFTWAAALLPLFIIELALLGMGVGLILSSLTAKYKDLNFLTGFISTAWMYLSPVIYTASSFGEGTFLYKLAMINPVTPIIETVRYGFLGSGGFAPLPYYFISVLITLFVLFVGTLLFNRVERNFIDTV